MSLMSCANLVRESNIGKRKGKKESIKRTFINAAPIRKTSLNTSLSARAKLLHAAPAIAEDVVEHVVERPCQTRFTPPPVIAPVFFQRCVAGAAAEHLNFSPHRLCNSELLRPSANPMFHSSSIRRQTWQRYRWTSKHFPAQWLWQQRLGSVETDHVWYMHRNSGEWFVLNPDASSVQESTRTTQAAKKPRGDGSQWWQKNAALATGELRCASKDQKKGRAMVERWRSLRKRRD
ncbi:hypothetical protein B0H13DRAFT_1892427 [Mycena leptocephala]|nr:hypothetical protein B0H13DRAFT_1892427 [Mycena leptocephala]